MPLYNCKSHAPNEYVITKFDDDLNVESSYLLLSPDAHSFACECPAGSRPFCRHRDMLPMFIASGRINSTWVLDWDGGHQWRQYVGELGGPEDSAEGDSEASTLASTQAQASTLIEVESAPNPQSQSDPYIPFASDACEYPADECDIHRPTTEAEKQIPTTQSAPSAIRRRA